MKDYSQIVFPAFVRLPPGTATLIDDADKTRSIAELRAELIAVIGRKKFDLDGMNAVEQIDY